MRVNFEINAKRIAVTWLVLAAITVLIASGYGCYRWFSYDPWSCFLLVGGMLFIIATFVSIGVATEHDRQANH